MALARREVIGLLFVLLGIACAHLVLRAQQPEPRVWGDELHYWAFATHEATEGQRSLLPGSFGFDHRPQLASRVFAQVADDQGLPSDPEAIMASARELLHRVSAVHIALLCLALAAFYVTSRLLGLTPAASFTALLLLGLLPQVGFHVHSLWPESLHLLLSSAAFMGLCYHLRTGRNGVLVPAGLAFGYALHAKGSLQPVLPMVPVVLFAESWFRWACVSPGRRLGQALATTASFVLPLVLVIAPQLWANVRAGHGATLSANRWWNLELGLTLRASELRGEGPERFRPLVETSLRYFQAADDPLEREALARERTLDYLGEHLGATVVDQLLQTVLVFGAESSFSQSLGFRQRWGSEPPGWMTVLGSLERVLWYPLLALALVGAGIGLRARRGDPCWRLIGLTALAFLAGLSLVAVKFRFLLPLVPALCLFAGLAVDGLGDLVRSRSKTVPAKTLPTGASED